MTRGASKKRRQYTIEEDDIERDPEDEDGDSVVVEPETAKAGAPKVIKGKPRRDMYKAFEGSALLAIGKEEILLQTVLRDVQNLYDDQECYCKSMWWI